MGVGAAVTMAAGADSAAEGTVSFMEVGTAATVATRAAVPVSGLAATTSEVTEAVGAKVFAFSLFAK